MQSLTCRHPWTPSEGSTAIALGRTSKPDPAETRRIFHAIDRQADLLNHLVENALHEKSPFELI